MPSTSRGLAGARLTRARFARPEVISTSTEQLPAEVHHLPADDGLLGAPPDQRRVGGDAVRAERGQVARGLDEVGLADAVGPDEDRDARGEVQLRRLPGPEVGDRQAAQVHERQPGSRTGISRWR